MSKILVALWSFDSKANYGLSEGAITDALVDRLKEMKAKLSRMSDGRRTKLQGIFMAPEYLYCAPDPLVQRVAMTSVQKAVVQHTLCGVSRQYPKILIVGGTVFYQEAVEGEVRNRMTGNLFAAEIELKKEYAKAFHPGETLTPLQIAQLDVVRELRIAMPGLEGARRSLAQDFIDRMKSWTQRGITVPGLLPLSKALAKTASSRARMFRARNCAYLFLDGQIVGMYDKHSDFQETRGASPEKLAFLPGTADQAPEVDGLRFGVEICFDHGNAVLKNRGLSDLDFHLVVSDSVGNSPNNMAMKPGGYYLHASSAPSRTIVMFRELDGTLTDVPLDPKPESNEVSYCTIDSP